MKQFISVMRPGRPELQMDFFGHLSEKEKQAFFKHVEYLKKEFADGTIVFAGPSVEENEEHFAIAVLVAEDKAHAQAIMDADPAVSIGILSSHVSEFEVFLSREFKP